MKTLLRTIEKYLLLFSAALLFLLAAAASDEMAELKFMILGLIMLIVDGRTTPISFSVQGKAELEDSDIQKIRDAVRSDP